MTSHKVATAAPESTDCHDGYVTISAVLAHLEFLRVVETKPQLCSKKVVNAALSRYELYWLPLAAKMAKPLPAPLDVEWVWHLHMLAPTAYNADSHNITGTIVDHRIYSTKERTALLPESEQLWESTYPEEPYNLDLELVQMSPGDPQKGHAGPSRISYDIQAAAQRHMVFIYQVLRPHFQDTLFLKMAVKRYHTFLEVAKANLGGLVVPTYDIDLIWHTHQLHPVAYLQDTTKLLGKIFDHDDSINDRTPGAKLDVASTQTASLWRRAGQELAMPGCMYRGAPQLKLQHEAGVALGQEQYSVMHRADWKLQCFHATLQANPQHKLQGSLHMTLEVALDCAVEIVQMHSQHDGSYLATSKPDGSPVFSQGVNFSRKYPNKYPLTLRLQTFDARACCLCLGGSWQASVNWDQIIGQAALAGTAGRFIVRAMANSRSRSLPALPIELELALQPGLRGAWLGSFTLLPPVPSSQRLGQLLTKVPPSRLVQDAELMVLPQRLQGRDLITGSKVVSSIFHERMATWRTSGMGSVSVTHSTDLMLSAIEVFVDQKNGAAPLLMATAHTIGGETLPQAGQVGSSLPVLGDPGSGRRSMLIRAQGRDWAIISGQWEGFVKGVKPQLGSPVRRPGNPGELAIQLWLLPTIAQSSSGPVADGVPCYPCKVSSSFPTKYFFEIPFCGSVAVNLATGNVELTGDAALPDPSCTLAPQCIAIGVAVAALLLLTKPYPAGEPLNICSSPANLQAEAIREGASYPTTRRSLRVTQVDISTLVMCKVAGFYCSTVPTNAYITQCDSSDPGTMILAGGGVVAGCGAGCGGCGSCGGGGGDGSGGGGDGGGGGGGGGCGGGGCGGGGCGGGGGGG